MKKLFDEKGLLNTEDLIMNAPSFQKIVEEPERNVVCLARSQNE